PTAFARCASACPTCVAPTIARSGGIAIASRKTVASVTPRRAATVLERASPSAASAATLSSASSGVQPSARSSVRTPTVPARSRRARRSRGTARALPRLLSSGRRERGGGILQEAASAALAAEVIGGPLVLGAERGWRDRDDHVADRVDGFGRSSHRLEVAVGIRERGGEALSVMPPHQDLREDRERDLLVACVTHVESGGVDEPLDLRGGQSTPLEGVADNVAARCARDEAYVAGGRLERL